LRSVYKKGFLSWLKDCKADIVCLQEIKIQENQIPFDLVDPFHYKSFFSFADRKGYSGVGVYINEKIVPRPSLGDMYPETSLGLKRFDGEGRLLQIALQGFTLLNLYMPHGNRDKRDLPYKFTSYGYLLQRLKSLQRKETILMGDFNVAYSELDLARPKENQDNIMFTPEERALLDSILELGFVDSFRLFNEEGGNYTWWPYYNDARKRNLGWRLDYAFVSKKLAGKVKDASILGDVKGSDHCPVEVILSK